MQSLYDHPLYYDVLFGWDRDAEAAFYDACLRHYGVADAERVIDLGCGSGQIALRLARRGRRVIGLDLSPDMLEFLAGRAREEGVSVEGLCADMRDFALAEPAGGAYSTLSSIRMLGSDAEVVSHLRAVASALRPNGVYVLDLTLAAPGAGSEDDEAWTMTRGAIEVAASADGMRVTDPARDGVLELAWGPELRPYAPDAFSALVARGGGLRPLASHPDLRASDDEISRFDVAHARERAFAGRQMLVLRRD